MRSEQSDGCCEFQITAEIIPFELEQVNACVRIVFALFQDILPYIPQTTTDH